MGVGSGGSDGLVGLGDGAAGEVLLLGDGDAAGEAPPPVLAEDGAVVGLVAAPGFPGFFAAGLSCGKRLTPRASGDSPAYLAATDSTSRT